ncbi:MAG: membrane protein insertase YidC [Flavobacteriaceae bacterium]|nr:membrane protein insertase YidC [Bacteroidia bacterium]NNF75775.1 membrane protein insertase YidC [Flavobacteriaceae bacterium]
MEEKKLDINSIIGFVLIFLILIWMLYQNQPTPEELEAQEKAREEQVEEPEVQEAKTDTKLTEPQDYATDVELDSVQQVQLQSQLGAFAYSATLPSAKEDQTVLENEVLRLTIDNKGGFISEVKLKEFVNHDSVPIFIVKENNNSFNINFGTSDNRIMNTQDLFFDPQLSKNGENQVLSMRLKVSDDRYLEYRYEMSADDYMLGFTVRSQGLNNVINSSREIQMDWALKGYRHAKSISYENRYTRLTYMHDDGKVSKLAQMSDDDEIEEGVEWISFRQHFFSSILVPDQKFSTAELKSFDLVEDEDIDTLYTKNYSARMPLALSGGELNSNMKMYYGPTDHRVLKKYEKKLEESIPFGWGIFGWINKSVFIPLFAFLSSIFPYGIAIIIMTIVVRLVLSPVLYKSYLSQAKMKILKPEITEINEKYKDNALKRQQETMALYSKAGASPMSGCLPALLQLPVFYALFMFFPTAFDLRQKSFLWAEDLSSYDTIAELPFRIPFYGDHVSLFPILAAVAIFFYMKMTTGQQMTAQPTQEGMPDMGKMMKYMIYFSPLLMLVFFNNYASGLSLYYFISNLITIGIMLVIKRYILDEDKIHATIQEKKKRPRKQNKFQKRMQDMMAQAEQQREMQKKGKK